MASPKHLTNLAAAIITIHPILQTTWSLSDKVIIAIIILYILDKTLMKASSSQFLIKLLWAKDF